LNFIYIDGPRDTLLALRDIADMVLRLKGAQTLPDGNLRVSAYATDDAITEIQNRGASVTVIFNNDELKARTDELFPPGVG